MTKKITFLLMLIALVTPLLHAQTAKIFYSMSQAPITGANAIIDATSNTTGTLMNSTPLPDFIEGAVAQSLTAWNFENTDAYIKVPANATTSSIGNIVTTTGITMGFWADLTYNSSLHANHRVAGIDGGVFDFNIVNEGIEFRFASEVHKIRTTYPDNVFDGGWEHLVVTLDFTNSTNNLSWYLDGILKGTTDANVSSSFHSTTDELIIGARSNETYYFPGKLDDFIVFDEALSSTDVLKLYQEGGTAFCNATTCTYAPSAQVGGYIYGWENYDTNETTGLGARAISFDFTNVNTITHAPPVGIHPRVYFNPEDIPDIQNRLANTESGQNVAAQIHAYTTLLNLGYTGGTYSQSATYALDPDGNRWVGNAGFWDNKPYYDKLLAGDVSVFADAAFDQKRRSLLASIMALEAFECLINAGDFDPDTGENYDDRANDLATAQTFWANFALTDPMVGPNGNDFRYFPATHMGLTYDMNFHAMTTAQKDIIRQAVSKVVPDEPRHGKGMIAYANTSNWTTLNSFEILPNLAIEGEAGYKPALTHEWMRALHNFITYGWYPSGAGYEGLGKNYQMATTLVAAAKRGYSLLGHPHVRAYATEFLPAITQPFGYGFTSYDVWGGSGYNPEKGEYKFNSADAIGLKWIFPNDPSVDFVWRNYIQKAYNSTSDGYVYQQFRPDDSYLNYMVPAAVFALDYSTSTFNTQAATVVPTDYFAADRGLAIMRSGTDDLSLSSQFHCRQDMGGHTHGDRNDFTLSGLGRIWVRKSYGGSPFQPMYFHSGILIDDKGIGIGDPDGDKARQPGKLLDYQSGTDLTCVTGDATYAYTWEWHWSPQVSNDHPWLGTNGWEEVTETWNDFQYIPQTEPQFNIPFYDFPHWHQDGKLERMVKREYNPMQRVIRTVGMVKGNNPFMLVVDDIQKDNASHTYKWVAQVANDLEIESTTINLDDCRYQNDIILKEPDATGNRRLLVRILNNEGYTGGTAPGYLEELEYVGFFNNTTYNSNPNFFRHRLVVESNSIAPDFRVLLFPYTDGDALPETSWNATRDSLVVRFPDEEHVIAFTEQAGGDWHKIVLTNDRPIDQIQLQVKAYLQGPYTGGMMSANLNTSSLLPSTEPFTGLGYTHYGEGGGEAMAASATTQTGNDIIVDWVVIELRDENTSSTIIATRSALLQRDGDIVDLDGTSVVTFECLKADKYHVAVRHRNHLGVMTALPIFVD